MFFLLSFFKCFPYSSFFFLKDVFCFLIICFYMCFFDCKCKSLKRLGENNKQTERNRTNIKQLEEKQKTTEIQDIQPSTRPRIRTSQVLTGRFLFLCVFFLFFFFVKFMFSFFVLFFLKVFLYVFFRL